MNQGKIVILKTLALALALVLLGGTGPALAVDDLGLFELDGDAVQNAGLDDWDVLYSGGGSHLVFTEIIDDTGAEDMIFTGGRKDIQDVSQWGWKYGSVPDKDQITNAYAAAYEKDGDLIAYFGCDRYANKGDAYLAFWFF